MSTRGAVAKLADEVWAFQLDRSPYLRVRGGLPVERVPGVGFGEVEEAARFARQVLARMDAISTTDLDGDDADTLGFLRQLAVQDCATEEHYWLAQPATPYGWMQFSNYSDTIYRPFRFADQADVHRYLSLVRDYAGYVTSVHETAVGQIERDIRLPRPALPGVRATIGQLRAAAPEVLSVDESRLTALDSATATRLRAKVADLIADEVLPEFDQLLGLYGDDYEAAAPDKVGLAHQPGGEAAYRSAVRLETTPDSTPEDLHDLGLAQCAELGDRMREVRVQLGFTGPEEGFREHMRHQTRLYASSADEVEARYLGYMAKLEPLIGDYFSVLPNAPYGVARLDAALEAGATYGYYEPPTPDRPIGRYRYNASDLGNRSLVNAAAIIYHELAPGHHFHLARQSENESLPVVRRELIAFGSYNEGWAEYAAGLGWEMGLYEDPWDAYGRLSHERFVAQRLVLDTGMNLGRMTLEEGRSFMRANTLESDVQIGTETVRYSTGLPAQALAYRFGHLFIDRLRSEAQTALGADLDIRDFHEAVLGGGALPLPVLEARVRRVMRPS